MFRGRRWIRVWEQDETINFSTMMSKINLHVINFVNYELKFTDIDTF